MVRYSHVLLSPSSKKEEEKDDGRAVALRMEAEKRDIKHYGDYGGKRLLERGEKPVKSINFSKQVVCTKQWLVFQRHLFSNIICNF